MSFEVVISLLSFAGTLLLVVTGALNFSVFLRQLRAAREQLETARQQLENARRGPEIQLFERAMLATSDYLVHFVERPYLRPYFYEDRAWKEGDRATHDEVKIVAEIVLNAFASAIIQSAAFPEYPARSVEQTIRFHLRQSAALREYLFEAFDRFPLSGLALLCLQNGTREETEAELRALIDDPRADGRERARREQLLAHLRETDTADPLELAKFSLQLAPN